MKKLVGFIILVIGAVLLTGCATTTETYTGSWMADGFESKIEQNHITIELVSNGTRATYWDGDFKPSSETMSDGKVVSNANQAILEKSLVGSQDTTKTFSIKGNTVNFNIRMMGVSRDITLTKVK